MTLRGARVVVTREEPGDLAVQLAAAGAVVEHVPLIGSAPPADGGVALRAALDDIAAYDWLVVTSPNGARAVVAADGVGDLHHLDAVAVACVGEATAGVLRAVGIEPALVPVVARLDGLLAELPHGRGRVLVARADRADPRLAAGLAERGWTVDDVVAYRTLARTPTAAERARASGADAVVLASGSAALAWVDSFGTGPGPAVISIGPSTSEVAEDAGLTVAGTADEQSVAGIVAAVRKWAERTPAERS